MLLKLTFATLTIILSSSAFAVGRIECRGNHNSKEFFKLKKISTGSESTWDLSYRFDSPIDGIQRIYEKELEGLNCKFDSNQKLAPSFYCVANDGLKVELSIDFRSSFNTKVNLDTSKSEMVANAFFFRLVKENAGTTFHGKSPYYSSESECKWTW